MYYKLGQACATNWGSFVLLQIKANVVTNCGSFIITNWGNWGKLVLQVGAAITNKGNRYYKIGQLFSYSLLSLKYIFFCETELMSF